MRKRSAVHGYVLAVCGLGLATLMALLVVGDPTGLITPRGLVFWLFVLLGELFPITVQRQGEEDEITTSTTFALALLLTAGALPAVIAQASSSIAADLIRRKPLWKAAFNGAQYVLSLAAAAVVLNVLAQGDFSPSHPLGAGSLAAVVAAGAVFFVANTTLTGTALALAQKVPVLRYLAHDLLFQASTDGLLVALTPIVVVASDRSLFLVPLIAAPMLTVHKATRTSLENATLVRRLEESLTDLQQLNRLNEHQALHDALTGLPNRTLFLDRVAQAIRAAHREGHAVAVMIIDLDRFKDINDTLGHHLGDLVLQEVGHRLQENLRESDTIARLGGDEFAILVPKLDAVAAALLFTDRIRDALAEPFQIEGLTLEVEASIGIAQFPDHGMDCDTLIQHADLAMYVAKGGTQGFQVYSARYDQHSRSRLALMGELRRAIEDRQLLLHYQPKVELATGRPVGVEALLRWRHRSGMLIPPGEFVPFAERTGLIRPLTLYVVEEALRQASEWRSAGLNLGVAVNLSARNVADPQMPEDIHRALLRWDVPAAKLELEITESSLMAEPIRAMEVLTTLSRMGVALSLDDFGAGYSSLGSLKRLPVDEIKIDRSFVANMARSESDAMIVRSTIDLGHNLGLRVVAEGVETAQCWELLSGLRCDAAQGFFISRPMPSVDVASWIEGWRARGSSGRDVPGPKVPA
jgi:diguanylate cyclase (GGDEF)-like protein